MRVYYTGGEAPPAPTQSYPDSAGVEFPTLSRFSWTTTGDSTRLMIAGSANFASTLVDTVVDVVNARINLSESTTYYWRLAAKNTFGYSDTTQVWKFTTTADFDTSRGDYFVDGLFGDNGNDGSFSAPWETIAYAVGGTSALARGDTLLIRGGDYSGGSNVGMNIAVSGTDWIYVRAFNGEQVICDEFEVYDPDNYWHFDGLTWDGETRAAHVKAVDYVTFKNCDILNCTEAGFEFNHLEEDSTLSFITIEACSLSGNLSGGENANILIYNRTSNDWTIKNNYIYGGGETGGKGISWGSSLLTQGGERCKIDSNTIIDCYESGIDVFNQDTVYVRWNKLFYNGQRDIEDGEWGDKNLQLRGDVNMAYIYKNEMTSAGRYEFQPTGVTGTFYFWNNLCKVDSVYTAVPGEPNTTTRAAFVIFESFSGDGEVKNNIFVSEIPDSNKWWLIETSTWTDYEAIDWSNNLYWNPDTNFVIKIADPGDPAPWGSPSNRGILDSLQAYGYETNSIWGDPIFNDNATRDFTLNKNSPCIDAGVVVGGDSLDWIEAYSGDHPDIGPYEFIETDGTATKHIIISTGQ